MALLEAKWQRPQQIEWDGVNYDISVCERGDGLFEASWFCSDCGEDGVLAPVGATPKEVLSLAHIGLRVHHQLFHFEGQRRKPR